MAYLAHIAQYKQTILRALRQSPAILELLLDKQAPSDEEFNQHVFPYDQKLEGFNGEGAYLFIEVDPFRSAAAATIKYRIMARILVHKNCLFTPIGSEGPGLRADCLAAELSQLLENCLHLGVGGADLESAAHFTPSPDYCGRKLLYVATECAGGRRHP